MRLTPLLVLVSACSGGRVALDQRADAPRLADSRCQEVDRSTTGLPVLAGEQVHELYCMHESGRIAHALLVVDHLDKGAAIGERLTAAYVHNGEWGATAAPTTVPTVLSGAPATEHRQPFELLGQDLLVFRYVQRGDSLFAAWISGRKAEMEPRAAENAAWLDAVRFDDLAAP